MTSPAYKIAGAIDRIWKAVPAPEARAILATELRFIMDELRRLIDEMMDEQGEACDHKFIDSTYCLKCGWKPER